MIKSVQVFLVWVFLCFTLSAQAHSNSINPNWSNLSQVEYVDNLVACELALQAHKWSLNVWPEANSKPKPDFSEVVDVDKVWEQVLDNLKMQSILADRFNTSISHEMLQHDLDRMTSNTQDAKGLKALFKLFDNNPDSIAQCISRPYLVKQKTLNNYNFNSEIHAETKALAQTELDAYLTGDDIDRLKAQVSTLIFEIEQEDQVKTVDEFAEEQIITLSAQEFNEKVAQLKNIGLQEKDQGYVYSEIVQQSDDSIRIKTLFWPKVPLSEWLERQDAEIYQQTLKNTSLHLPAITGHNNLSTIKAGTDGGTWESRYYLPSARQNHTAVWSGHEMIIWGGQDNFGVNTGGRYNPVTDSWTATSTGANTPSARYNHTAIWSGSEMIVWGGNSGYLNTGGRYDPVSDSWTVTSIGANVPTGRSQHTAIWSGDEMIIWGGMDVNYNYLNTGGRYNPASDSWTTTSTGADVPSARYFHTAIWSGYEMIIWGGNSRLNTGGRYNPTTDSWSATSIGSNVPSARFKHSAVWSGHEMIIWGGLDGGHTNTGGRYNPVNDSWAVTSVGANVPSARKGHSAIWSGNEMIVWSGQDVNYNHLNSGARYNPVSDSWKNTSIGNNVPTGRIVHTAIWIDGEMIVWGGYGDIYLNTGGRYDPVSDSWTATGMGGNVPSTRQKHTGIWSGNEMIIWGGTEMKSWGGGNDFGYLNIGSRYNPTTDSWTATSTGTDVPLGRYSHTAIWNGAEMIIWGGYDEDGYANTGGRYNPIGDSWTSTSIGANVPMGRHSHTAIWSGDEMIIWGGTDVNYNYLNTGGRYNPTSDSWTAISIGANVPTARSNYTAIWSGSEMIIWGGYDYSYNYLNTGGRYNPLSDSWSTTSIGANVPMARYGHVTVWSGSEMIVWGGVDINNNLLNTGGQYNPISDSWTSTSIGANVPTDRAFHSAVWSGSEVIIWGGNDGGFLVNTGGRYNPVNDSWVATSTNAGVPKGRQNHTAIWSGNKMIIWGGQDPSNINSLGIYSPNGTYDGYSISGTLSGLVGNQVILQNKGGDDLTLTANGAFQFNTTLAEGSYYEVTVLSNPQSPAQTCTVTNGSGYITADVTDVLVQCNTLADLIFRDGFDPGPTDLIFRDGFEGP